MVVLHSNFCSAYHFSWHSRNTADINARKHFSSASQEVHFIFIFVFQCLLAVVLPFPSFNSSNVYLRALPAGFPLQSCVPLRNSYLRIYSTLLTCKDHWRMNILWKVGLVLIYRIALMCSQPLQQCVLQLGLPHSYKAIVDISRGTLPLLQVRHVQIFNYFYMVYVLIFLWSFLFSRHAKLLPSARNTSAKLGVDRQ